MHAFAVALRCTSYSSHQVKLRHLQAKRARRVSDLPSVAEVANVKGAADTCCLAGVDVLDVLCNVLPTDG